MADQPAPAAKLPAAVRLPEPRPRRRASLTSPHSAKPGWVSSVALLWLLAAAAQAGAVGPDTGVCSVLDFGAKGDGTNNDTAAIQRAIDACATAGGGQVLLPGGKCFLAGALILTNGVDFHLARGAVLKARERWQDYGQAGALLFAKDSRNLSISGDGIIDGNDRAVWQRLADEQAGGPA